MAYDNAVDILMRFVLDKQSVKEVESGITTIDHALEEAGKSVGQFVMAGESLQTRLEAQNRELNLLQGEWRKTQRAAQAAEFTFRTVFVAGAAVTGAIVGVALSYVDTMNEAKVVGDATLNRWNTATASLQQDKLIIGQIATEAILPALELATDLADKATKFASDNPKIITAALNVGVILATLGAVGLALTTGFKLYVDTQFIVASAQNLAAGELMIQAARTNLEAALIQETYDTLEINASRAAKQLTFTKDTAVSAVNAESIAYAKITEAQAAVLQANAAATEAIAVSTETIAAAEAAAAEEIATAMALAAEAQVAAEEALIAATTGISASVEGVAGSAQAALAAVTQSETAKIEAIAAAQEAQLLAEEAAVSAVTTIEAATAQAIATSEAAMLEVTAAQSAAAAANATLARAQMTAVVATERVAQTAIEVTVAEANAARTATTLEAAVVPVVGASGIAGLVSSISAVVVPVVVAATALYIGSQAGSWLGNQANKKIYGEDTPEQGLGDNLKTMQQITSVLNPLSLAAAALHEVGVVSDEDEIKVWKFVKAMNGLGDESTQSTRKVIDAAKALADAEALKNGIKVLQNLEKELAKLAESEAKEEINIKTRADKQLIDSAKSYEKAVISAAQALAHSIASINAKYATDEANATASYELERAKIIRDAEEASLRAEQKHQDDLEKMLKEHQRNVYGLALDRDALGLVNEKRRYDDQVDESNKAFATDRQQRAQELANRLADQTNQYNLEKAQRYQDYINRLAEAQAEYDEKMKQALIEKQEKEQLAAEEKAADLAALAEKYNQERIVAMTAAYDRLHDLADVLSNEQALRNAYYQAMGEDLNAFLANFQSSLREGMNVYVPPPSRPPSVKDTLNTQDQIPLTPRATGGYAPYGAYLLGDTTSHGPGDTEYVLSGSTTKAAEHIIGGRITQQNILNAMVGRDRLGVMELHIQSGGLSLVQTIAIAKQEAGAIADLLVSALQPVMEA